MTLRMPEWAVRGRRWLSRALDRALGVYTPTITWTVIVAYAVIGWGLVEQPYTFSNTPSYANLIHFRSTATWGAAYLASAALLAAWRLIWRERGIGFLAHIVTAVLTVWWLGAFIIRWQTDKGTTVVNPVSWTVFLSLVVRSWRGVDDEQPR